MDASGALPQLPPELYTDVFKLLFWDRALGLKTLLSLLATSRYIRAAASPNVIWLPYYRARYTHSVWAHEQGRHAHYHGDARLQYFARRVLDQQILRLLDDIRTQVAGRGTRAQRLVKEFSFDAWDVLRLETQLPVPQFFRRSGKGTGPAAPNALPRRYWAGVAQGIIARYWAVQMWKRVASGDPSVTFEEMIGALATFFEQSPTEVRVDV